RFWTGCCGCWGGLKTSELLPTNPAVPPPDRIRLPSVTAAVTFAFHVRCDPAPRLHREGRPPSGGSVAAGRLRGAAPVGGAKAGRGRAAQGQVGRTAVFRWPDRRAGRRGAVHFTGDGRPLLGLRARLAASRGPRPLTPGKTFSRNR